MRWNLIQDLPSHSLYLFDHKIIKVYFWVSEWKAIGNLVPEPCDALKHVATIESIGSSTRIEGVKLSDREIGLLLSGLEKPTGTH